MEQENAKAADELLPPVYEQLHVLAFQKMAQEQPGQTLQATALVHEAYVRLVGDRPQNWDSRGHFFSTAAEAMPRILADNARRNRSLKSGGKQKRAELDDSIIVGEETIHALDIKMGT